MSADKLFAAMYIMKNNSEEEAGVIRRRKRLNFAGQSFVGLRPLWAETIAHKATCGSTLRNSFVAQC